MKKEFYGCSCISSLLMFGIRENKFEPKITVMWSGKRYRVDTRKGAHGQDSETFVETKYSPMLSESESEREYTHPDKPQINSQYSPTNPKTSQKPESNKSQGIFESPTPPPHPL